MHPPLKLVALLAFIVIFAHELIPHPHPWDAAHDHRMPPMALAQSSDPSCSTVPMGALPGQPAPIWCYDPMETGPSTFRPGANTWEDSFDHHLSLSDLGSGYKLFDIGSVGRTRHWRHNEHWMIDIEGNAPGGPPPYDVGGSMLRPDQTFRFVNGQLVIEAEVAAGIREYNGTAWPELVVTTASAPTQIRPNGTYVYEAFPNHWTVGCRLQSDGAPTCALLDNTAGGDSSARVWEISHFQCGNTEGPYCTQKYGGHPSVVPNAHRFCEGTDPDTNCRDKFRWEISKDRLTIYVNGIKYMEHAGFDPRIQIPDALLNADVYVYFGEFLFKTGRPVTRFHWDRIAVNPGTSAPPPPSTSPAPTATSTPTRPPATATATATSVPAAGSQTVTFDDRAGQNRGLNGQYPSGVINWGTGKWFHSGPWGALTTKSVSFNGGTLRSASFTFVSPRRLLGLDAYSGGGSTSLTLSCSGQPTRTVTLAHGQLVRIQTGWTGTCTTVTITSTNGWDTNFDNLVHDNGASTQATSGMSDMAVTTLAIMPVAPKADLPPAPQSPAECSPRPPVEVRPAAAGGRLRVTVAVRTSPLLPSNQLLELRFGAGTNALIDAGGQVGQAGNFSVELPPGTQRLTFELRRVTPGQAATVPLVVVDECGDWSTFVGGGADAF